MLAAKQDDVSNIHRRWSFTRITPGTLKASYAMMCICATIVIAVSHIFYLQTDLSSLVVHLPLGLGVLFGLTYLDSVMLRGTPVNKMSKVVHVTSFANLLWAMTVIVGILSSNIFAKPATADYIVAGMLLAAGLRVGIFVSVFGASLGRAVAICLVQPLIFFFAFVPTQSYGSITEQVGFGFGVSFVALAISWTIIVDRSGRPEIPSTFRILQAFLSAWTENKAGGLEDYLESRAHGEYVSTKIIRFLPKGFGKPSAIILPDVHPGPFGSVGGSNLPYVLFERFAKSALVMHGVSDHSLNIPSKAEVDRYVKGLSEATLESKGEKCSLPVQHHQGNATATAIIFGKSALIMLSLAPKGMEDVPQSVRKDIESYAAGLGISSLLVDCHNAMGEQLSDQDTCDLIGVAKKCLDDAVTGTQAEFDTGFAGLAEVQQKKLQNSHDLGQSGLGVITITTQGRTFAIGWADSNNMENALRDKVLATASSKDVKMLEVCSSDTHSTSGKRTSEGYFALGGYSDQDVIASAYAEMCKLAHERASPSMYEVSFAKSEVKVMGEKQFQDYSGALDRAMNITKVFVGATVAVFIAMQILA
jgi:putative membrane protein